MVRHVPTVTELAEQLTQAGFMAVRFEKLSEKAHFTMGGVEMREFPIVGQKPGHRPAKLSHSAIYLGPLALVTDDFGSVFRRSEFVSLNIQDWAGAGERYIRRKVLLFAPAAKQM